MRPVLLLVLLVAAGQACQTRAQATKDDDSEFTSIFDGKTLSGWTGEAEYWRVEDGAIVGEIPKDQTLDHNTWLIWEAGKLGDFELHLQFRLSGKPEANSGIQFRCQVENATHVSGYQADMDLGATWLGRIYDEHGRALLVERGTRVKIDETGERAIETFAKADDYAKLFRGDEWNDYRIKACGEHVTVEINGVVSSEMIDRQSEEKDLSGQLAIQLHAGPETKIQVRNIRLRKLKPGEHRIQFDSDKG